MLKRFSEYSIDENYNPIYHSEFDPDYIEDVYQYMFDLGFRLNDYEVDGEIDGESAVYGKHEFKKYLLDSGRYGFRSSSGKNSTVVDNISDKGKPSLVLDLCKKFKLGGHNKDAISSFDKMSDVYKDIASIIVGHIVRSSM